MDLLNAGVPASDPTRLRRFGLLLWGLLVLLIGTYFRMRGDMDEEPTLDWLVLAQLLVCGLGGGVGLLLLQRRILWGTGTLLASLFVTAALFSCAFSDYARTAAGYTILLIGASLLTAGLVTSARSARELQQIEAVWLAVMLFAVFKDTALSLLFPMQETNTAESAGMYRLGMGVTHANQISLAAALCFFLSLRGTLGRRSALGLVLRGGLIAVLLLTRSRFPLLAFFMGGVAWVWMGERLAGRRSWFAVLMIFGSAAGVLTLMLLWVLDLPLGEAFEQVATRGDASNLYTLTGRVYIWRYLVENLLSDPLRMVFGYGYGCTRFLLAQGAEEIGFFAKSAHNALLEASAGTGILGAASVAGMMLYALQWIVQPANLRQRFPRRYLQRAGACTVVILFLCCTEALLTRKISPTHLLFLQYLLALDTRSRWPILQEDDR